MNNRFLRPSSRPVPQKLNEAQAKAKMSERVQYSNKLIETWARTEVGTQKLIDLANKNPEKARNVAILIENQNKYLKDVCHLKEGDVQVSSDFQLTPTNVLKVVRLGAANSNRGAIFKEVALVTMRDIMVYVQRTFGKTKRGGTANNFMLETVAPDYASSAATYDWNPDGSTKTFTATVTPNPVMRLRTLVIYNGRLIGVDDGNGKFSSTLTNFEGSNSTVNYGTGAITLNFTTNLADADTLSLEWMWDTEDAGNYDEYGSLQLNVKVLTFNPILQPLGYQYSTLAALTLGSTGIGDMQEMLVKNIGDAHASRKDLKAVRLANQVASGYSVFTFDTDYASNGTDNDFNHTQRVTETLGNIGTTIFNDLQRGGVNALVAGTRAVNYLRKHRKYETDLSQGRVSGTYLDGKLDSIPVYVAPSVSGTGLLDQDEILCVYKNPDEEGEPSIVFGTFTELSAGLEFPEFYTRGNIGTVEDYKIVQPKFLRKLKLLNVRG
jgi:hypothetical protein